MDTIKEGAVILMCCISFTVVILAQLRKIKAHAKVKKELEEWLYPRVAISKDVILTEKESLFGSVGQVMQIMVLPDDVVAILNKLD